MPWITPIYDRTESDAIYARLHPDTTADLKGAWNVADYVRAKGDLEYVAAELTIYGYPVTLQAMPDVTVSSLGMQAYVSLLTDNAQAVVDAFTTMATTPAVPEAVNPWGWSKVNDLEQILADVEALINKMSAAFIYCGTIYSGEGCLI